MNRGSNVALLLAIHLAYIACAVLLVRPLVVAEDPTPAGGARAQRLPTGPRSSLTSTARTYRPATRCPLPRNGRVVGREGPTERPESGDLVPEGSRLHRSPERGPYILMQRRVAETGCTARERTERTGGGPAGVQVAGHGTTWATCLPPCSHIHRGWRQRDPITS